MSEHLKNTRESIFTDPAVSTYIRPVNMTTPSMTVELMDFFYQSCQYFWGKISHEEAAEILVNFPDGSFLIREKDDLGFELIIRGTEERFDQCLWKLSWEGYYGYRNYQPAHRTKPFSLQELCRYKIRRSVITEDNITQLSLPEPLKKYLK